MPALQRAIADASRSVVYDNEGFHPDITYGDSMRLTADEMTALLADYFTDLSYQNQDGLFNLLCAESLNEWLNRDTRLVATE